MCLILATGFLKSSSAAKAQAKPKFVYLLGSDDFSEEDVPSDAFVVYQVNAFSLSVLSVFCCYDMFAVRMLSMQVHI